MVTIFPLPHSLWLNVMLPFLEIHDLLNLRLVNHYFDTYALSISRLYYSALTPVVQSFVTSQANIEITRILSDAVEAFEKEDKARPLFLVARDRVYIRWCPECIDEALGILDAIIGIPNYSRSNKIYSALRKVTEITDPGRIHSFLTMYSSNYLAGYNSAAPLIRNYFERVMEAVPLQTDEYLQQSRRVKEVKGVYKVLVRLLERRGEVRTAAVEGEIGEK